MTHCGPCGCSLAYLYGTTEDKLDLDAIAEEWLAAGSMPLFLVTRGSLGTVAYRKGGVSDCLSAAQLTCLSSAATTCLSAAHACMDAIRRFIGLLLIDRVWLQGPPLSVALDPVKVADTVGAGDR